MASRGEAEPVKFSLVLRSSLEHGSGVVPGASCQNNIGCDSSLQTFLRMRGSGVVPGAEMLEKFRAKVPRVR